VRELGKNRWVILRGNLSASLSNVIAEFGRCISPFNGYPETIKPAGVVSVEAMSNVFESNSAKLRVFNSAVKIGNQ
jgi:hypothetical protein